MQFNRRRNSRAKSLKILYSGALVICGFAAAEAAVLFSTSGGVTTSGASAMQLLASRMATTISNQMLALTKLSLSAAIPVLTTSPSGSTPTTPTAPAVPTIPATQFGVNLSAESYFVSDRGHMNLFLYGGWFKIEPNKPYGDLDAMYLGPDGWVKTLPASITTGHALRIPTTGSGGTTFRCTYDGNTPLHISGQATNIVNGKNEITFKAVSLLGDPAKTVMLTFSGSEFTPASPPRNIDCREADAPKDQRWATDFVSRLSNFKVARFMDFQRTNENNTMTWATRTTLQSPSTWTKDGIAVEDIVSLSNQAHVDPWVTQPWNADADYIQRFAQYIHDNLAPDRKVYVETSNEVWNDAFPVAQQALAEGVAEGLLPDNKWEGRMQRYAERSTEIMKIWTKVFADNPSRLVRVLAAQNANPYLATIAMGYKDTAQYVDALATAPYFGFDIPAGTTALGSIFSYFNTSIDDVINAAVQNKATATKYGKRYIAYEAGQHVIMQDLTLQKSIQRDDRMYDSYGKFISAWKAKLGDTIAFYESTADITTFGAWGLVEYAGQPLAQAPKMRAVLAAK